ncbi:N-acetyldiaminopimelate deacetylase [Leuconostocaceae bacterium ESL0723]|nr:N-acetyldiaminopimelate deacetylase [Leuconostocaceae bacterium ESL0723]
MAELNEQDLIDIRRHLHTIPELALHEVETQAYLEKVIAGFRQDYLTIKKLDKLPTALLIHIKGSDSHKTIGYRSDIDALPVTEETGLPFASKHPGRMHACGHDIHMTVALGLLSYYAENQPNDDMVFFFQPAEESESGGLIAYELGAFEGEYRPDEFYALHDNPQLPAGAIGCRQGTLFAGTSEVDIDFTGKGGHAAYPQDANDMVVAAASFVTQAQTIVSRSLNPIESGVVTLGKIEAGTVRNVIAGKARIEGTIRGLKQPVLETITARLKDLGEGVARSYNCQVDMAFDQGCYLPVVNNPELTTDFIDFMKADPDVDFIETQPAMTGEDFGYLLSKIPGTMFWLGVEDNEPLHSAKLSPKEAAISRGVNAIKAFLDHRMAR